MLHKNKSSVLTLLLLLTFTAVPKPLQAAEKLNLMVAQAPSTVTPSSTSIAVPSDAKIEIDGSTSMKNINQALKERFEKKFPGAKVKVKYDGSDAATKAVEEGKLDLSAIGRNLTQAEKAKGLKEAPISRNKIALIVSIDNPFNGSLTIQQFAQIFRGEIKNWSEVGGASAPVRFIDRPETSDTRQAFPNYPVFQKNFKAGTTAVTVPEDTTEAVIAKLGKDGIGYAIADQVINNPKIKVLKMHDTLPDNPNYPFSQALVYVYKGPNPNAAVKAFLGYATNAENQAVIEEARKADTGAVSPSTAASPETALVPQGSPQPEANPSGGLPSWLWWLLLPLAGLLFFLFKGRDSQPEPLPPTESGIPPVTGAAGAGVAATEAVAAAPSLPESRLLLTPRDCRHANAFWEVPETRKATLCGQKLALRLYDVTDLNLDHPLPETFQVFECDEQKQNLELPIEVDDRDYLAELGYITQDNSWLPLAKSEPVHIPACHPVGDVFQNLGTVTAGGVAAAAAATGLSSLVGHSTPIEKPSQITLVPHGADTAEAEWEVSEAEKAARREQGGEQLTLRIHDATNLNLDEQPPHSTEEYPCDELDENQRVAIPVSDRDYVAELGYLTGDNRWLSLVRSLHVHIPAIQPIHNRVEEALESGKSVIARGVETLQQAGETAGEFSSNFFENALQTGSGAIAGGAAAVAGVGAAAHSFITDKLTPTESQNRITLVPRSPQEAYIYWEVSEEAKEVLRRQGGERLTLRLYEMTTLDAEGKPINSWQYDCEEVEQNKQVPIHISDRNYMAELGYLTAEGSWLSLRKSDVVQVPSA